MDNRHPYIVTDVGWLYLTGLLDLESRQVVVWSMKEQMQASLVWDVLRMSYFRRQPQGGLMVHSDRGSQCCEHDCQNALKAYGMKSSMSRRGDCWADLRFCHNAPTESLWGHLKVARVHGRRFHRCRAAIDKGIDWLDFYNSTRLHQTLDYVSPLVFEQRWNAAQQQDRKTA